MFYLPQPIHYIDINTCLMYNDNYLYVCDSCLVGFQVFHPLL